MHALPIAHLAFCFFIAVYLAIFHPGCEWFVTLLFIAALLVELLPRWFRRHRVPELFLLAIAAGFWQSGLPALHGAIGMMAAYWLLVPCRPGRLKWISVLVPADLVLMGNSSAGGLGPLITVPMGIAALGVDRWLLDSMPATLNRVRIDSLLRWAIAPAILASAVALLVGSWAVTETKAFHARNQAAKESQESSGPIVTGFDGNLAIGGHRAISRDTQVVATLTWESGAPPEEMIYLRALALPDLVLSESTISWEAARTSPLRPALTSAHQPDRWARLYRMPCRTDVVLRVDGGRAIELAGLFTDQDGNLYRRFSKKTSENYRVDFDDGQIEAELSTLPRCRVVAPELDALPWSQIEDPLWRRVRPEQAARLIAERLAAHCRYDIENLPLPAPGAAGVLREFLFGRTRLERTGHCQYFATAAVLLLRRAGHTARCVSGYASEETDGRSVTFRNLHAHAWIELVNSQGHWQRFDPTPSLRNTRILQGIDVTPASGAETATVHEASTGDPTSGQSWWPGKLVAWLILPAFSVYLLLRATNARRETHPRISPRIAELQRRNDDLIQAAVSLGIVITPATTLSAVVEGLEELTGIPLDPHLNAHLAARFGHGPLPEPWPIDALLKSKL